MTEAQSNSGSIAPDSSQTQLEFESMRSSEGSPGQSRPLIINSKISPAVPTKVFDALWRFADERQRIFYRKVRQDKPPWTDDPILRKYKFTNAFRASDRVSQYLIRNVIYRGDQTPVELFFRILLFKVFNKISTWELLERSFGAVRYADYSFDRYDTVLSDAMESGRTIYSGAYIMPPGTRTLGSGKKHRNYLRLIERMVQDDIPKRIAELRTMMEVFELLSSYPMLGDFLAYQFTIDINYSELTDFSESDFVVPGPGALGGIRKCFDDLGGLNEVEVIKWVADRQEEEFERMGLEFKTLWGRQLQLIDCQNLFCEIDKYARVAFPGIAGPNGRKRIKQKYTPQSEEIAYWYPPKWGINERITRGQPHHDNGLRWRNG